MILKNGEKISGEKFNEIYRTIKRIKYNSWPAHCRNLIILKSGFFYSDFTPFLKDQESLG